MIRRIWKSCQSAANFLLLPLLIVAGYAGNYFSISLFFAIDFLLGSISVLLVTYLYGTFWGTVASIVASIYTYQFWGHPYAMIIFAGETFFVGFFLKRNNNNILLLDGIYWIFIGMPLVWLFYAGFLKLAPIQAGLIFLKQPVNGLFNALITSLIVNYFYLTPRKQRQLPHREFPFKQSLFNLLVGLVFVPALVMTIWEGKIVFQEIQTRIYTQLNLIATNTRSSVEYWYQQHLKELQQLEKFIHREFYPIDSGISRETIETHFSPNSKMIASFDRIYITDATGEIIAAEPQLNQQGESTIGINIANQSIPFQQVKTNLTPVFSQKKDRSHCDLTIPMVGDNGFQGVIAGSFKFQRLIDSLPMPSYHTKLR